MFNALTPTATVLLLDDHPLYRAGFVQALTALRPQLRVEGVATLAEALARAVREPVHAVLIDMHLHGEHDSGLLALVAFAREHPRVARLVITGDTRGHLPLTCKQHGAHGFICKSDEVGVMWPVIEAALQGRPWQPEPPADLPAGALHQRLTPRQLQVLRHLGKGLSNQGIADTLGLTERAVKMHMTNLLQLAGAANRVELLRLAREAGWLAA
ncbi:MAG: response regulator transcription factor [Pseudomonadota bacterium]|nr:response regulator transcription factor [Pseudomonadota bacterium]